MKTKTLQDVGRKLFAYRTRRHLAQEDIAIMLGVTKAAVSAWETGKHIPRGETLETVMALIKRDADTPHPPRMVTHTVQLFSGDLARLTIPQPLAPRDLEHLRAWLDLMEEALTTPIDS